MKATKKDIAVLNQLFSKVGAVMAQSILNGADEKQVFGWTRDKLAATLNVPPLQAANLARLCLNQLAHEHTGQPLYSAQDMQTVVGRAFPG